MGFLDTALHQIGLQRSVPTQQKAANMETGATAWFDIMGGNGSQAFSSYNSSKQQLNAYTDWVYAAARSIAEVCATIDLRIFVNHTGTSKAQIAHKMIYNPKAIASLSKRRVSVVERRGAQLITRSQVPAVEELESHPLLDLLNHPNPYMTRNEFFELSFLHMELTGEAFWAVNRDKKGIPNELWPLMPNAVSIVPDKEKFIIGYVYNVNGEQIPFSPDDIIHHKYANPGDLRRGMSTVMAAARTIDTDSHASDYNRKFFYNSAQPDAVLETDGEIDAKMYKRLKDEWNSNYGGSSNAHKTAVLEGGLKYKPMVLSQKDMDFLAARNFNRDMILALFGVPKSIIGLTEDVNRATAETAEYVFSKNKIRPKMMRLVNRITEDLAPQFDAKIIVSFTDPVPDDKEFLLKEKQASIGSTNGLPWRTINEIRAEDGDTPIDGGDELWIEGTMVPMAFAAQQPVPEEKPSAAEEEADSPNNNDSSEDATGSEDDDSGDSGSTSSDTGTKPTSDSGSSTSDSTNSDKTVKVKSPLPVPEGSIRCACCGGYGEHDTGFECYRCDAGGSVSDAESDQPIPCDGRKDSPNIVLNEDGQYEHAKSAKAHAHILPITDDPKKKEAPAAVTKAQQLAFADIRNHISDRYENEFAKIARAEFNVQKEEVIKAVKQRFKGNKTLSDRVIKGKLDDLFDKAKSKARWAAALIPTYKKTIAAMGQAAFRYVASSVQTGTSAEYSSNVPAIGKYMDERTTQITKTIDEETEKQLRTTIAEGVAKGESVRELTDRVEGVYSAISGYRALRIARTESIASTTFATLNAWEQSGVVSGKQWMTAGNACPYCAHMDGKVIGLSDNYFNQGDSLTVTGENGAQQTMKMDYSNVQGPPVHPNCRCTLIPILK